MSDPLLDYLPRPVLVSRLYRAQRRVPVIFVAGMLVGALLAVAVTVVGLAGVFGW